jgi:hypothetical protein
VRVRPGGLEADPGTVRWVTKTAVGTGDEGDDKEGAGLQFPVPPALFRFSAIMAERNAELGRQLAAAFRPQMPAFDAMQQALATTAFQSVAPQADAFRALSEQVSASIVSSIQAPAWEALREAIGHFPVPPIGTWLPAEPEPTEEPVAVDVIDETAERLHTAGVTAADLDVFALVVFGLRMMALGGVITAGVFFGGPSVLASLAAFGDFLGQLQKMRERLAELEVGDA